MLQERAALSSPPSKTCAGTETGPGPPPQWPAPTAGLDYPGIGPEHSWLHDVGRAEYVAITDKEALEPSHALAHVMKIAPALPRDHLVCMNLCGRGDKDIFTVARHLGMQVAA